MVRKSFVIIKHSIMMVCYNIQSYFMLSITIVLSFMLLLGYLIYSDSALYNKYKNIFNTERNMLSVYDPYMDQDRVELLLKQTEDIENTYHYITYETTAGIFSDNQYQLEDNRNVLAHMTSIMCIPNKVWSLYEFEGSILKINYLNGCEYQEIVLNQGEAFMDEITFRLLGLDKTKNPVYHLCLNYYSSYGEEKSTFIPIRIIGTFSYNTSKDIVKVYDEDSVLLNYSSKLILSTDDCNPQIMPELNWQRRIYFYSESPELVDQATERLSFTSSIVVGQNESIVGKTFTARGVYRTQNEALEKMQMEARTKAIIAAALLLLLGINLYSSFTNALNDRKFEIGVKRAIGASSWEIIRQFLYESILVMMANIVLSIALVTDIFIVYKFIYESIPDEWGNYSDWIICISPYSIAMFAICSVTLTVVFSLIFAYKSTQVEIVQYLKAE